LPPLLGRSTADVPHLPEACGSEGRPDAHERAWPRGSNRRVSRRATLPRQPGRSRIPLVTRPERLRGRVPRRRGPDLRSAYDLARTTQLARAAIPTGKGAELAACGATA